MTTQRLSIFHPYTLEDKDSIDLHRILKNFPCKYLFVFKTFAPDCLQPHRAVRDLFRIHKDSGSYVQPGKK